MNTGKPRHTRLRFVSAKSAGAVSAFLMEIDRVQIYGNPTYHPDEKRWYCWFVVGDRSKDIPNVELPDSAPVFLRKRIQARTVTNG